MIDLNVLGPPQVVSDGVSLDLQRKPLALLAYLALAEPQGLHRRDTVIGIFWPEHDQQHARPALRQALHTLRRALGDDVILSVGDDRVGLDHDEIRCDARAFDEALEQGQTEVAAALYKGSVLQGLYLDQCPEFEHWLDGQQQPRATAYADALEQLAATAEGEGDHHQSADWLHRLLRIDPLNGRVTVLLMNALGSNGDRAAAIRIGEKHVDAVKRELNGEAESKVLETIDRLRGQPTEIATPHLVPPHQNISRIDLASVTARLSDRYRIVREVGAGLMAKIFLGEDLKLPRKVAVKVLKAQYAASVEVKRFLQEVQIAGGFTHPHIITVLDSGEAGGMLYYVMPYIEGETLRHKIHREGQLEIAEALQLATQMASALSYSHRHNVVHRDLKPENILLHEGEALIVDFGIALAIGKAGGERLTESGLMVGTPEYMSPEQATQESDLDGRSDIYTLGCVLYEMLTGEQVFTGASAQAVIAKHQRVRAPSVRVLRPEVSVTLEQVIERALAKLPEDRFASAEAFQDGLGATQST